MAFTNPQKVTIRRYLGWPLYASYDTTLESVMDSVGNDVDASAVVVAILANIVEVEARLFQMHKFTKVSRAEEVVMNPMADSTLRAAGRRECIQLGACFNTRPRTDVFAAGSWMGGAMAMG